MYRKVKKMIFICLQKEFNDLLTKLQDKMQEVIIRNLEKLLDMHRIEQD